MSHVYYTDRNGLAVAHEGADYEAALKLLRGHDPELRLSVGFDRSGRYLWKVYRWCGPDRPSEFILAWMDERGDALPLSSGILYAVQRHDRNSRGFEPSDPDFNRKLVAQRDKDGRADTRELAREYGERIDGKKSSPLFRSQSLRRARDKIRRTQRYPELRP